MPAWRQIVDTRMVQQRPKQQYATHSRCPNPTLTTLLPCPYPILSLSRDPFCIDSQFHRTCVMTLSLPTFPPPRSCECMRLRRSLETYLEIQTKGIHMQHPHHLLAVCGLDCGF